MTVDIIGIDCATDPANTGVAHATVNLPDGRPTLRHLSVGSGGAAGSGGTTTARLVSELLSPPRPALIGLDAPLGWPEPMGRLLTAHRAGEELNIEANLFFRRHTDRVVRRYLGKQTLDVGADRIARTAVAALEFLTELRRLTDRPFPVATHSVPALRAQRPGESDAAVEVYPRGRLIAHHGSAYGTGYRARSGEPVRRSLIDDIAREMDLRVEVEQAVKDVDLLDAMLCVLAAVDVLRGRCTPPEAVGAPLEAVRREGWIWLPLF
ncbi:MAG: DUF429 domain-containing protein [Spirochaetota bacterium]